MTGIIQGLLASIGSAVASAASDAYFNLVTLLLNISSTNGAQNNTFLDSSTNNFSITRNGNTTQGTFTPFSQTGWSNYLDGTAGQYLNTPSNAAFAFGTGDFTVEAWVFVTGTSFCEIFITTNTTPTSTSMRFIVRNDQKLEYSDQTNTATSTGTIPLNTWTNVAVSRSGTSVKLFINGTQDGSTTSSNNLTNQVGYIGRTWDGFIFTGYISNLRVTKGGALYTSNFTPSTVPLTTTVSSGTVSLLTCQSNRFLDNSTNAFAITVNGTPSVQAFSPFLPTAAYDAAVVGGSGYFDGTGDYLTWTGSTVGTAAYTFECWFYTSTFAASQTLIGPNSTTNGGYGLNVSSATSIGIDNYGISANNFTVPTIAANAWHHIAVVRNGSGVTTVFLDGVRSSTGTITDTNNYGDVKSIGYTSSAVNRYFTGYISSPRYVTSAVYDPTQTTITVPTAPLTAITNTQLLLSATNAGIYDSSAKNDLETVGNAQVSTTQAKWGTTSMYFDGTGDNLYSPYSVLFPLGTGDFTIEWWMNPDASQVNGSAIFYFTVGSNYFIAHNYLTSYQNLITVFVDNYGAGTRALTGTTSLSSGTWYHVAITRASGTWRLFVNGSLEGSTYSNSAEPVPTNSNLYIGQGTAGYKGYIDDFRITKGYARYTATFTPPTAAFPVQ